MMMLMAMISIIVMITIMMIIVMCTGQFAGREAADSDLHGGGPGQRLRGGCHIPGTHSLPALYIWLSISEISFLTTLYKSLIHSD